MCSAFFCVSTWERCRRVLSICQCCPLADSVPQGPAPEGDHGGLFLLIVILYVPIFSQRAEHFRPAYRQTQQTEYEATKKTNFNANANIGAFLHWYGVCCLESNTCKSLWLGCPTNFRFIWSERKNKTPKRKQLFSPKCENMHNEAKQVYKAKIVGIENMKFCVETKCRFQFSFKKKIVDSKRKMCLVLLDFWVFWTIFALFHFVLLTTSNWKCIFIAILPIGFKRKIVGHSICDIRVHWLLSAELSKIVVTVLHELSPDDRPCL